MASTKEKDALIAQALSQGLITEADLLPDAPGTIVAFAVPTVTAVAPTGGPLDGGQVVAITGTGFTGATAVKFDTVDATSYAIVSNTRIVATVPDGAAAGAKIIKVTNVDGTNSTGSAYTYGAPTVTSVSPAFADPATETVVTITGTGFLGLTDPADVLFGVDEAQEVFVVSDKQIVATTPDTDVDAGLVEVTVTRNGVASSTAGTGSDFLFSDSLPEITSLGATTGAANSTSLPDLVITGTDMFGVRKVNFGPTAVTTGITVNGTGTTVTVKPPSRPSGPVEITLETAMGTTIANLNSRFSYIGSVAPTVSSINPAALDTATGGSFLVVGTGFGGMTAAKVTLKCTADITPDAVVVISDTQMIVTVPDDEDGPEDCDLEVVNPTDNTKKVTVTDGIHYLE
ncbi:MAG: IPT/TIG domain-containing protein [Acidimicrobiales bacterium]